MMVEARALANDIETEPAPAPLDLRHYLRPGDTVIWGQSCTDFTGHANSEAPCIGRWAALNAGLPLAGAGMQLDRRCGGGLQAIISAAMMVQTGAADVVLAGGAESMSNVAHYTQDGPWGRSSSRAELHDR